MKAILPAIVLVLGLCGCATPPVKQVVPFTEGHLTRFQRPGTSEISGEAFLRRKDGELMHGGGRRVYLMPLSPYTDERGKIMFEMKEPEPADPRLAKYVRSTTADSQGRFSFEKIPAGAYILYCKITWVTPDGTETGGYAITRARVAEGENAKAVVSR